MTVSQHSFLNTQLITDLEGDGTPEQNLIPGTGSIYMLEADNSQNTVPVYVKIYNATTVSVGTDLPTWCFMIPAGAVRRQPFGSRGTGRAFSTGVSLCCVTTGGTGGAISPTNEVPISLATT
jgi:hypothetical protein